MILKKLKTKKITQNHKVKKYSKRIIPKKSSKYNKSLKSMKYNKYKKSNKFKQQGGLRVDSNNQTMLYKKYGNQILQYIKNSKILKKTDNNLNIIKSHIITNRGVVYDFIFSDYNTPQSIGNLTLIWEHGDTQKNKIEDITAGKQGLHVYVQINMNKIKLLGIILHSVN